MGYRIRCLSKPASKPVNICISFHFIHKANPPIPEAWAVAGFDRDSSEGNMEEMEGVQEGRAAVLLSSLDSVSAMYHVIPNHDLPNDVLPNAPLLPSTHTHTAFRPNSCRLRNKDIRTKTDDVLLVM